MPTNSICYLSFIFIIILNTLACDNSANGNNKFDERNKTQRCQQKKVNNEFIVQWKDGSISKVSGMGQQEFLNNYIKEHSNNIITSEPNYKLDIISNDIRPLASCTKGQWGVEDINVKNFWTAGITGKNILIAVSDSGIDVNHPALKNRIAHNDGESGVDSNGNDKSENGIDDDGNGYVDDYYGYDFVNNDGFPDHDPRDSHGTAVAGTIASEHIVFKNQNGQNQQVFGIAPGAKIIPIKFIDEKAGDTQSAVNSLKYAIARKAQIINASWGGSDCSSILPNYIKSLEQKNILFVAASGNESLDLDNLGRSFPVYPASLNLKNQITVGAIGFFRSRTVFSNYGQNSVELFAPGSEIVTLAPGSSKTCFDGTSFAAPIVSGALALLMEAYPKASPLEIKKLLLNNVHKNENYINLTNGTLDLSNLLPASLR